MYIPGHFAVDDRAAVAELIDGIPTAQLVVLHGGQLDSTLVPVLMNHQQGPFGTVLAHVARANPLRHANGADVLVLWTGAQAYISPSAYPSKHDHGKVVPTWNYLVAQGRGRIRVIDDPAWLADLVRRLTDHHESGRLQPWSVDDAPRDYLAAMIRAISGIEIELTALEVKVKASQNRSSADRDGVVGDLLARGDRASATLVQRWAP